MAKINGVIPKVVKRHTFHSKLVSESQNPNGINYYLVLISACPGYESPAQLKIRSNSFCCKCKSFFDSFLHFK